MYKIERQHGARMHTVRRVYAPGPSMTQENLPVHWPAGKQEFSE